MKQRTEEGRVRQTQPIKWHQNSCRGPTGCGLLTGLFLFFAAPSLSAVAQDVPNPELATAESAVAEKIGDHRRKVLERPTDSESWSRYGRVLHAHELLEEAAVCYRQTADMAPDDYRWHYLYSIAAAGFDLERARSAAQRAKELAPASVPVRVNLAELYERSGIYERAIGEFKAAIELDANCTAAQLGLGRVLLGRGELEVSMLHLLQANELQPNAQPVHALLARLFLRLGDSDRARQESSLAKRGIKEIALKDPVMSEVIEQMVSSKGLVRRALLAFHEGDIDRAKRLLIEAVSIRPEDPGIQYQLASINARSGDMARAKQGFHKVLELAPDYVPALVDLAIALIYEPKFDPERLESAREYLRSVLKIEPENGKAHVQMAVALARLGDYEASWQYVESARLLGEAVPEGFLRALEGKRPAP